MAAVRMHCTPMVCCVQPTAYTHAVVLDRPEFSTSVSATAANAFGGIPQACSTSSGVYWAKCRLSTWNTHRGCVRVGSRSPVGCHELLSYWPVSGSKPENSPAALSRGDDPPGPPASV